MDHIMVDLETLGTVPGCSILSIGAVAFDPRTGDLGDELYMVVSRQSCRDAGLFEQEDTLAWWERQTDDARVVLTEASEAGLPLAEALEELNEFIRGPANRKIWGNGADFDNPLLRVAYHKAGVKPAFLPYNGRCYRTLKNLVPHVKMMRGGTHHNALDDAKSQARHLMEIVRQSTLTLA